jgi:endonuclease/exonuclease/phosphatase (EEP) superfamily protein YafD
MSEGLQRGRSIAAVARRALFWLNALGIVALGGCTLFALLARTSWVFDIFTSFVPLYFLAAAVGFLIAASFRSRLWSAAAFLLLVYHGWLLAPYAAFSQAEAAPHRTARIMLSNLYAANSDITSLIEEIERQQPDVLCLQEVTLRWERLLTLLRSRYPYEKVAARDGTQGIALLSRWPLRNVTVTTMGGSPSEAIRVTIELPGGPLSLMTMHAYPPMGPSITAARNLQLSHAAEIAREADTPFVLIGDLNIAPWSPFYDDFVVDSGLQCARQGHGILPTWPVGRVFPALVPIDHALCSPDVRFDAVSRGNYIGSDHLPLVVDLAVLRPGG